MKNNQQYNVSIGNITKSEAASAGVEATASLVQDKGAGDVTSVAMSGDGSDPPNMKAPGQSNMQSHVLVFSDKKLLDSIFSFCITRSCLTYEPEVLDAATKRENLDLLNASLTCKRFYFPAMRLLWQSVDSLAPLVTLMPEFGEIFYNTEAVELDENPGLRRLGFYANLIEKLHFDFNLYPNLEKARPNLNDLSLLLRQYLSSGLLPFLKILVISNFGSLRLSPSALNFLDLVIPQKNLSHLTVTIEHGIFNVDSQTMILHIARLRSPMLTGLTLHIAEFSNAIHHTLKYFSNLERINIDIVYLGHGVASTKKGPCFRALTDLSLAGPVHTIDFLINFFSDGPLLERLTISLKDGSQRDRVLFQMIQKLAKNESLSLKNLVINSASHDPHLQLGPGDQVLKFFGQPLWKRLSTLSIPLKELTNELIKFWNTPRIMATSLERLTIEAGIPSKSRQLQIPEVIRLQLLFPNLKSFAGSLSLKIDHPILEYMKRYLSDPARTSRKCNSLEELTLLPFAVEHPRDDIKAWEDPSRTPPGIFKLPEDFHPSENIAELVLLSRFVNHIFPHLKKINVERLYEFVDRAWLDGLKAGVQQFRETSRQGNPKVCPRCHSPC